MRVTEAAAAGIFSARFTGGLARRIKSRSGFSPLPLPHAGTSVKMPTNVSDAPDPSPRSSRIMPASHDGAALSTTGAGAARSTEARSLHFAVSAFSFFFFSFKGFAVCRRLPEGVDSRVTLASVSRWRADRAFPRSLSLSSPSTRDATAAQEP